MVIEDYSSQKIADSNEFQLEEMLKKFQKQQISYLKVGGFLAYNVVALLSLGKFASWYIKSNWLKSGEPRKLQKKQLNLFNIVKKGSGYGILLGGIYIVGLLAVGSATLPISTFKKYCELQEAKSSFTFTYDPFYQEMLLFRKMKKFGLSDSLIDEIRAELNSKRDELIEGKQLKEETILELKKAAETFSVKQMS